MTLPRLLAALALPAVAAVAAAAPPTVTHLFPSGARRGHSVTVEAGGTFPRWPVRAWVDRPGITVRSGAAKGRLDVTADANATPGTYWVRLHDEEGASGLRPFVVGTLPEVSEQEPNDDARRPQPVALPAIVNGRMGQSGDVDCFAVRLRAGETLVASLDAAHNLRSPMDAILQVVSDGSVLEENHDDRGLDPQLAFTAKAEGVFVVRAFAFPSQPDTAIRFAGGPAYVYRLTLTTAGFADHAWPLAAQRSTLGSVRVEGWNVPPAARTLPMSAADDADHATLWHPLLANTLAVALEPHACVVEPRRDGSVRPRPIAQPVTVSGRIDLPGEVDVYEFAAKKGEALAVRVEGLGAGSLLDPHLRLTDGAGRPLAQADDAAAGNPGARDAQLSWTAPADGGYRVEVRDLCGAGGPRHFYRLRLTPAEPAYALAVAADRFALVPGKPLDIPVTVERRNGFAGEVEIAATDLPAAVTAAKVKSAGATGNSATLRLEARAGVPPFAFRIVGRELRSGAPARPVLAPAEPFPKTFHLWLTVSR